MNILEAKTSDGRIIGTLGFDDFSDAWSFVYHDAWKSGGFQLSPAIPFDSSAKSTTVKRFIENLLPEGAGLDALSQSSQISKSNVFALIRKVGHESAGATMFVPEGFEWTHSPKPLRPIEQDELLDRVRSRDDIPFSIWDGKVRLSIAGMQDKIAVFVKNKKMFLADFPMASTHILKPLPVNQKLASLVANEHFCMSFARAVGLSVAKTEIMRIPDPVLQIERFDRVFRQNPDRVDRLHIVDACQLLDLPSAYKYEQNFGNGRDVAHIRDGVSLEKIFSRRNLSEVPFLFVRQMLMWSIFQYLIGNTDAHGKNLSFFIRPGGKIALAPAYDMVSTVIYEGLEDGMAMSIGGEFILPHIGARHWECFAEECGIPLPMLSTEMRRMADAATKHINLKVDGLTEIEACAIEQIRKHIACRIETLRIDADGA